MRSIYALLLLFICFNNSIVGAIVLPLDIHFTFKKLVQSDVELMSAWFAQPHVVAWWPVPKEGEDIMQFLQRTRQDLAPYIAFLDEAPIGYIQSYTPSSYFSGSDKIHDWLPPLPENTVGIDQFIGDPDYLGKGYGTLMVQDFIQYLHSIEPTIQAIIVDPEPINHAAIRCYEKVGFKKMGTYIYEAPWGHALLMKYDL